MTHLKHAKRSTGKHARAGQGSLRTQQHAAPAQPLHEQSEPS